MIAYQSICSDFNRSVQVVGCDTVTAVQVFQLAQSTASAYLGKKLCFIVLALVLHCFHWRDDVCADALLKHFSCIILCRLAFGCLQ